MGQAQKAKQKLSVGKVRNICGNIVCACLSLGFVGANQALFHLPRTYGEWDFSPGPQWWGMTEQAWSGHWGLSGDIPEPGDGRVLCTPFFPFQPSTISASTGQMVGPTDVPTATLAAGNLWIIESVIFSASMRCCREQT